MTSSYTLCPLLCPQFISFLPSFLHLLYYYCFVPFGNQGLYRPRTSYVDQADLELVAILLLPLPPKYPG